MIVNGRREWSREVRKAMIDRNLRQKDLATKFYYSQQMINHVLSGKPGRSRLVNLLSDYFDIHIKEGTEHED